MEDLSGCMQPTTGVVPMEVVHSVSEGMTFYMYTG